MKARWNMQQLRSLTTTPLRAIVAIAVIVVAVSSATIAFAEIPNSVDGKIYACYKKKSPNQGSLRVIDNQAGQTCSTGELPVSWNQQGIPGVEGTDGQDGQNGQDGNAGQDGLSPVEHVNWTATLSSGLFPFAQSNESFESGSTVKGLTASMSGDFSACDGFRVDVGTLPIINNKLASWSGAGGVFNDAAPDLLGSSVISTGTELEADGRCVVGGTLVPFPEGVSVTIKVEWTHVPPTHDFTQA